MSNKNESEFEKELIDRLQHIGGTKQWIYKPEIKTVDQLWENFKSILEQHNHATLKRSLSVSEFSQVKKAITDIQNPYQAGQFIYGINGVTQIEVDLDDEDGGKSRHVFLTVFDQKQIGAGDTIYQVVNQIELPYKISGTKKRRFDTTLLINGLPIIQIEEKSDKNDVNEALNQMHQYISENQYSDIFSTLQILIAITPNNVRYMANTTEEQFNKAFALHWKKENNNKIVRKWREFVDSFLSIPMAHQMSTNFMILDGSEKYQQLKVMRPYQVYATKRVIEKIEKHDFSYGDSRIGYIWHTTGSGKTITSFKTAWLANRLPNVDKVVFLVDRIDLTIQTFDDYKAYDPDFDSDTTRASSVVSNTENVKELKKQLQDKRGGIIVTSIQKLSHLVNEKNFESPNKKIVFIVDEAHRSTSGDDFKKIQNSFRQAAWVGYTGTPMFDATVKKGDPRTEDIFGESLHEYTIREAIEDDNVLGFLVDFETTLPENDIKEKYLPEFFKRKYPDWSDAEIESKINSFNENDIDEDDNRLESSVTLDFYDNNQNHVETVVKDIFEKWKNRSVNGEYGAILTTSASGNNASIPMAMMYYEEFQKQNSLKNSDEKLKVTVMYSYTTDNSDNQKDDNKKLLSVINDYAKRFDTNFSGAEGEIISKYKGDVLDRLRGVQSKGENLDILIVVDQLLTGFDANRVNTLYVDRVLKNARLIQAYSRTNRLKDNTTKQFGRIVNYRWPKYNKKLMDDALAIYSNIESRNIKNIEEIVAELQNNRILAKDYFDVLSETKEIVGSMKELTDGFNRIPASETKQEELQKLMSQYNSKVTLLKQYTSDNDEGGELSQITAADLGFDNDQQERMLTTVIKKELKDSLSKLKEISPINIDLNLVHVTETRVNFDYLNELLAKFANQLRKNENEEAKKTFIEIEKQAIQLEEDEPQRARLILIAAKLWLDSPDQISNKFKKEISIEESQSLLEETNHESINNKFLDFITKWGLIDVISVNEMMEWFENHHFANDDLNNKGALADILAKGSKQYQESSEDPKVKSLSKIKYRLALSDELNKFADEFKGES